MEGIEICTPADDWDWDRLDAAIKSFTSASNWLPPRVVIHGEDEGKMLRYADCLGFMSIWPVFHRIVIDQIGDLLRLNGDVLPLNCMGRDLYLYRVTNEIDALDEENSVLMRLRDSQKIVLVECPVFKAGMVDSADIFRLRGQNAQYVSHRFVERWRKENLTGLLFRNTADMKKGWFRRGGLSVI